MHDGQMLFDASTTWNKQAWDVHLTVDRLVRAGRMAPTLIVGVWNNGKFRHSEYYPEKFLPYLEPGLRAEFNADHRRFTPWFPLAWTVLDAADD
jgi:hypothetical protein